MFISNLHLLTLFRSLYCGLTSTATVTSWRPTGCITKAQL